MEAARTASVLEDFVRDYVETSGGAWDEIEPQVYDVLLPVEPAETLVDAAESRVARIVFDPEAIPEHPGSQLASFGTPFVDHLLRDAIARGRTARLYMIGLNLAPHDLAGRLRRSFTLPPPWTLSIERVRPLHFSQALFLFQAEFISDRKEQEIIPVAMDLHHGREARHLDELLNPARLAEEPALPLPEARRQSLAVVFPQAREQVLRTFIALANTRSRELNERCDSQVARMRRYYGDLRSELDEQVRRAKDEESAPRFASRRQTIDHEEQLRVAELRHKSALRVHVRLLQLLILQQPKLLLHTRAVAPQRSPVPVEIVWDPLTESLEAVPCSVCRRPTFALEISRDGRPVCAGCMPKRS